MIPKRGGAYLVLKISIFFGPPEGIYEVVDESGRGKRGAIKREVKLRYQYVQKSLFFIHSIIGIFDNPSA